MSSALSSHPHSLILHPSKPSAPSSRLPAFIYGTAWKGSETSDLVLQALESGFRAVDTAAQPRHYQENLVGGGLRTYVQNGRAAGNREDFFIQTKYTPPDGQDAGTAPYDPSDSIVNQVRASVTSSLQSLYWGRYKSKGDDLGDGEDDEYIDCVLLDSPLDTVASTFSAWNALEGFVPHQIRHLGISNINLNNLKIIYNLVHVKSAVVQNRFQPRSGFDQNVSGNGMLYQAHRVLSANEKLLDCGVAVSVAGMMAVGREIALYCLVLALDNLVVLNGTRSILRMRGDIEALDRWRCWVEEGDNLLMWQGALADFKILIGDMPAKEE